MKLKVAVMFGGRAPEHEVSIITGIQVLNALVNSEFDVIPIYITKKGEWIIGNQDFRKPETYKNLDTLKGEKVILSPYPTPPRILRKLDSFSFKKFIIQEDIDVVFPAFHGKYGEDGAIQGLFEIADIAYVGCDVTASGIGMDKVLAKKVAKSVGIPVLDDIWISKSNWETSRKKNLQIINKAFKFPVFIKPVRLGSSIGLSRVDSIKELENSIDVAFHFDTRVMVEKGLDKAKEVNISIMGNNPYEFSETEMPISSGKILTFEDKYLKRKGPSKGMASAKRIIPAPVNEKIIDKVKKYSQRYFEEIGGTGIARIDFLVTRDEKAVFFNEINTMPGSVAYFLWDKVGVNFDSLVKKLINLALDRQREKSRIITTFKSNILAGYEKTGGIKK